MNSEKEGMQTEKRRLCCIYAYYEKDKSIDSTCAENLEYFINNGLQDNVDYYFVVNGKKCSVKIPTDKPNIKRIDRDNKGFDFGAYSHALKHIKDISYDYYFFINTSVRGPFLDGRNTNDWTQVFLDKFNGPDIKLVGTVINVQAGTESYGTDLPKMYGHPPPYTHTQSMMFCINKEYKDHLVNIGFFDEETANNSSFHKIVAEKEVGLSQHALNQGWNINSVVPKFADQDYRTVKIGFNPTAKDGEPYCEGCYFGSTIKPEDVVFFKTNRGLKI